MDNIRGLVKHAGFPVPDNSLDILRRAEADLRDSLTLIDLHHVMLSEEPEPEYRVPEIR